MVWHLVAKMHTRVTKLQTRKFGNLHQVARKVTGELICNEIETVKRKKVEVLSLKY